ncbi:MAG: HEAT repeat domain-containing protein [Cyanobacteria bacterium J06554_3]
MSSEDSISAEDSIPAEDSISSLSQSWTQSPLEETSETTSVGEIQARVYGNLQAERSGKSYETAYEARVREIGLSNRVIAKAFVSEQERLGREIAQAIAELTENDFHQRWDKAKRLSRRFAEWGDRAVPALIHHLKEQSINNAGDPEIQWFLIRILSQFDYPEVVEAIAHLLTTTPHDEIRTAASKALTNIGRSAVTVLTALLSLDTPEKQRLLAARTLAHIRRGSTIAPLLSVATDANAQIREIATEALGSFHDPRVTPVLLAALKDQPSICIEAIRALSRRRDLLTEVGLVSALKTCLHRSEVPVAEEAATALGRLGGEGAAIALGKLLTAPVATPVKISAVRALGWIDRIAATQALTTAFNCDVPVMMPTVQQEIAKALGQTQTAALKTQAAQPLMEWIARCATQNESVAENDSFLMKQAVISALSRLGDISALDVLLPMLTDLDVRIRLHALSAMRQINPDLAQQKIESYIEASSLSSALKYQIREIVK